jgi:NADH:ubiquinone oxidoreductase subunit E
LADKFYILKDLPVTTKIDMNHLPSIEVCFGPECSDKGSRELASELESLLGSKCIMGDCRSQCANAPLVLVDKQGVVTATVDKVLAKIKQVRANPQQV